MKRVYMQQRYFTSWRADESGATAIEFAIFVVPFLFIIIGIIELGMMFTAASLLQSGTDSAARLIRTGQAQQSADPQNAFEELLCDNVSIFIPCNELSYEVITIEDDAGFANAANDGGYTNSVIDEFGQMTVQGFDPGGANSLVIIRAAYRYPLMSPFVGPILADGADGKRLMIATAIIQNEPYEF